MSKYRELAERYEIAIKFGNDFRMTEADMNAILVALRSMPDGVDRYIALLNGEIVDNGLLRDEIERLEKLCATYKKIADETWGKQAEIEQVLGYATRLLESFVSQHFPHNPDWKPLPDLLGVLTQIDNATTITRDYKAEIERLRAENAHLQSIEMTWHREFPEDSAKDLLDIVAKALLLRAGGNVTLSGDEMRQAREVQAEFRRCGSGSLQFRVERQ